MQEEGRKVSRKLDVAVAGALGYKVEVERSHKPCYERYYEVTNQSKRLLPLYSTDGNAMLELIGEMKKRGWQVIDMYCNKGHWKCHFTEIRGFKCGYATADTLPLAVALAAYKALTGKEWEE